MTKLAAVYAWCPRPWQEAKTLGCLPGILRQVQGPPTTRRRLATGDPVDDTLPRPREPLSKSTSRVKSNPQHWANRTSTTPLGAVPEPSRNGPAVESRRAKMSRVIGLDLSIRPALCRQVQGFWAMLGSRTSRCLMMRTRGPEPSRCVSLSALSTTFLCNVSLLHYTHVDQSALATSSPPYAHAVTFKMFHD